MPRRPALLRDNSQIITMEQIWESAQIRHLILHKARFCAHLKPPAFPDSLDIVASDSFEGCPLVVLPDIFGDEEEGFLF